MLTCHKQRKRPSRVSVSLERAKFIDAKPVYFPPMENKWSNDDYGNGSYRSSVFHDADGSVGGIPDSYILIHDGVNDSVAVEAEACEIKPTWNAAVCTGDVGRLNVGGGGPVGFSFGGGDGGAGPDGPGGAAAAPPPVVLSRDGKEYRVNGTTNIRAGTEIKVTTERPNVNLSLTDLDAGSWVLFELPGFTAAASGTAVNSLDALRAASDTSYYKGEGSLWVKLVSSGDLPGAQGRGPSGGARLQVSR